MSNPSVSYPVPNFDIGRRRRPAARERLGRAARAAAGLRAARPRMRCQTVITHRSPHSAERAPLPGREQAAEKPPGLACTAPQVIVAILASVAGGRPHRHGAGKRAAAHDVGVVQVLQAAPAHAARRAVARVLELHDVAALLQRRVQRLHAEALRARAGRLQRAHRLQQLRPARAVTASPRKCILQPALKRVAVAGRRPGCTLCRPPWRHGQLRLPCTPPGAWLAPDIKLCGGKQQWTFVARAAAVGAVLHCEALDSAQHTAR